MHLELSRNVHAFNGPLKRRNTIEHKYLLVAATAKT